ncbi:MAG TPA: SgcJ/EcaC family oxidoreductase [Gallionellaceae bacterium]|nr:SgcJ/EcaC family oxidoreductase [Gallionellaceae bacterium]
MAKQNKDIDSIRQLAEDWRAGWFAGDAEALLSLYADDPVLMPWGQPAVFGKDAIRPLYQSVFKEYAFSSQNRVMDVEASGDWGYFWCTYRLTATPKAGGKPLEEEGKSVFIVRREQGGAWKIARLIDNSDRAPTGSP